MKTKILVSSIAAAGLALATTHALADADQPWHITGQVGSMELDSDRNTSDNSVWWSVGFGRFFNDNFSVDLDVITSYSIHYTKLYELVVSVELADLDEAGVRGPTAGLELQRRLEPLAFAAGGGHQRAPATRATDFVRGRARGIDHGSDGCAPGPRRNNFV